MESVVTGPHLGAPTDIGTSLVIYYTVRRENLNVLTNKLFSNDVQVFSAHPVHIGQLLQSG